MRRIRDLLRLKFNKGLSDRAVATSLGIANGSVGSYREYVDNLVVTLTEEGVAGRASDELHELMDRVVVSYDHDAKNHILDMQANLIAKRKDRPLGRYRTDIDFQIPGCGSKQPPIPNYTALQCVETLIYYITETLSRAKYYSRNGQYSCEKREAIAQCSVGRLVL